MKVVRMRQYCVLVNPDPARLETCAYLTLIVYGSECVEQVQWTYHLTL